MIEFAIVGLGSWGLCVLERTVVRARHSSSAIRVHLVEPGQLGGGVYSPEPTRLPGPQQRLRAALPLRVPEQRRAPPLCRGPLRMGGRPGLPLGGLRVPDRHRGRRRSGPTDYLPRRLMGEYLAWFYDTLLADAPDNLEIVRHYAAAVDISPEIGGREAVLLDNGTTLSVDHVVLTSGHTFNDEHRRRLGQPCATCGPIRSSTSTSPFPPGAPIAVAGMGLVGFDVLTALTVGRGGTFEDVGVAQALRARAGGSRPSTSTPAPGVPYCAKSAHGVDPYGDYQPVVCTPEEFAELTHPGGSPIRRQVDFRNELLPLLLRRDAGPLPHPRRLPQGR